jgi:hypothetical protein
MSVLKDRKPMPDPVGPQLGSGKDEWSTAYPGLWEMLTAVTGPGGRPRLGATLNLFVFEGQVRGCLKDRDQALTCFLSSATVGGVLEALERGLQADTLAWRAEVEWKGKKPKR